MRSRSLLVWASAIVVVIAVAYSARVFSFRPTDHCGHGVPFDNTSSYADIKCPIVGKMGGKKLAIPVAYLEGPWTYKGVNIWDPKSFSKTPQHPTLDSDLDDVGLKMRLTNFKPIETDQDKRDYDTWRKAIAALPPIENRWIWVDLNARDYHRTLVNKKVARYLNRTDTGTFVKQPDVWGLGHYISTKQPSTATLRGDQLEFFYDLNGGSTFILCSNTLQYVPPFSPLTHCQIDFDVPEISARVSILRVRDKADLHRWREIEAGVGGVIDSFTVR